LSGSGKLGYFCAKITRLNFELFIAKGILSGDKTNFSRPIVRISTISITLGLAVMILSLAITTGFKNAVSEKVIGFGSHIQISSFGLTNSWEKDPVSMNQEFYPSLSDEPGISHIQVYANKSGLIKTEDQIQGILLKGIWTDFKWSFFEDKLIEGTTLRIDSAHRTDDILISKKIADKMNFSMGDDVRVYFINPGEITPRGRKFRIAGIYETGLAEFDDLYLIGDIRHIQRLNKWTTDQVGGFEVFVDDFRNIDAIWEQVYQRTGYDLNATSIKNLYPQIFDWLGLQDMNVIIILVLMVAVAVINMISTLLILILEKTNMIGVLKALGTRNISVGKIFLYNAAFIIGRGLLFGNLVGIGLALLQYHFHFISLDQESYYVTFVPVHLELLHLIVLNLGTLIICLLFLMIPSYEITKISPVKAIRWE
jgi:lipoprotein-releasing system permease protein